MVTILCEHQKVDCDHHSATDDTDPNLILKADGPEGSDRSRARLNQSAQNFLLASRNLEGVINHVRKSRLHLLPEISLSNSAKQGRAGHLNP